MPPQHQPNAAMKLTAAFALAVLLLLSGCYDAGKIAPVLESSCYKMGGSFTSHSLFLSGFPAFKMTCKGAHLSLGHFEDYNLLEGVRSCINSGGLVDYHADFSYFDYDYKYSCRMEK